ncbi:uncharacterized protein LOC127290466 isoform X2 [Leptopilina boulardi]|uniref:uncharacterized protein LOC127290466 isoform X2 n=1 Tax=Leptopilina boulardi TaxID=63433 RepID=UPI0021F6674D|nr:uncharacterized protein LOC127290466 isoform X2 [Leptopilina boulardi]
MAELKFFLTLTIIKIVGVLSIQNDPTLSKSWLESTILSASAFTGAERTSSDSKNIESLNVQRTLPAFQLESSKSVIDLDLEETRHVKKDLSTSEPIDVLTSSKFVNHIDGNNIEVKPGDYYPSSTINLSGEGLRASQEQNPLAKPEPIGPEKQQAHHIKERKPRLESSRNYNDHAPPPIIKTSASGQRQANPDIQDIITGIVKLLNGNVNVAVNTAKPIKPTRINNRGPPRISDMAPLPPDFNTPGMNPPPLPPPQSEPPYPFETPPPPITPSKNQLLPEMPMRPFITGVPLPESIVPQERPWQRPFNRPGNNRRPIPPYKPLPTQSSFHKEKPPKIDHQISEHSSINKVDQETTTNSQFFLTDNYQSTTEIIELKPNQLITTEKTLKDESMNKSQAIFISNQTNGIVSDTLLPKPVIPLETESPLVLHSNDFIQTNSDNNGVIPSISPETTTTTTQPIFQTTLNIETSSSIQLIENTQIITDLHPTIIPLEEHGKFSTIIPSILNLEPSRIIDEDVEIKSTSTIPTEKLTNSVTKMELPFRSNVHPLYSATNFYSKHPIATDHYRPRPGIVLDDTLDYAATQRPYGPPRHPQSHETFDVVVSAIQGPGGSSGESVRVPINGINNEVILTSAVEGQGFVSIDGKRTYLNLFESTSQNVGSSKPSFPATRTQAPPLVGAGFAVAQEEIVATPRPVTQVRRPTFHRRPSQPPVRIDTCIVGDSSTCDASQHEACATVQGVSACHCKPGFARLQHSLPCKKIVSIVVSIRVDKIYDKKVVWDRELKEKDSESYQLLAHEANRAIESAMSMTPFSDEYVVSLINNVYQGDVSQGQGGVFVNATLKLAHESRTSRSSLAGELQRHLLGVIQRRNNNIGSSALYVESPAGSISNLQDLDECASSELNDCHSSATCTNNWGSFTCTCASGFRDPHKNDPADAGRVCLSCPSSHCNNRGTCSYQNDQMQCSCTGNYYGAQCEVDGEVLAVAIGASVAALIIIILTLVCLVMWSRRWSREQKAMGSPVYGYMQGGIPGTLPTRVGSVGTLASVKQGPPPNMPSYYWGHLATMTDHMTPANLYATEPMGPTRPSSAVFGYPTLSVQGTLPPVPLPRLQAPPRSRRRQQPEPDSSDSEPQDKDRADLIPQSSGFHMPRPKSRTSVANQSGIYYDVEYDQGDAHHLSKNNIPLSTYSMARPYYRT